MTEQEEIKKTIRHFKCMKNDAVAVLDSGFGIHKGEIDSVYRNRKLYAELAIKALEKQIPKKMNLDYYCGFKSRECPECGYTINLSKRHNYCNSCGQRLE